MSIQLTPAADKATEIYSAITINGRVIGDMTERTTRKDDSPFHACLRSKTPPIVLAGMGLVQGFGKTAEAAIVSAIEKRLAACYLQAQELRALAAEIGVAVVDPVGDAIKSAADMLLEAYDHCRSVGMDQGAESMRADLVALGRGGEL